MNTPLALNKLILHRGRKYLACEIMGFGQGRTLLELTEEIRISNSSACFCFHFRFNFYAEINFSFEKVSRTLKFFVSNLFSLQNLQGLGFHKSLFYDLFDL